MELLLAKYGKEIAKETIEDVFQRCNGNIDVCEQQISEMLNNKIGERIKEQEEKKEKTVSYHTIQQSPINTQPMANLNKFSTSHYTITPQPLQTKEPIAPKTQPIPSSLLPKVSNPPTQEINPPKPIIPTSTPILQKPIIPTNTPILLKTTTNPIYSIPIFPIYPTPTINNIKDPIKEERRYLSEQPIIIPNARTEILPEMTNEMTKKRAQPTLQTSDNKNEEIENSNNVMPVNLTETKRLLTDITSTRNEEEKDKKEKDIERLKEENKTMKTMIQEQQIEINQLKERIEQSNQLIRQILQILTK
ncbi:hypothetical protein ENUP19_0003G0020 [Entamoeba nuttalli]|uniref:Uncharacterized protein n=1 Tax=Entamoeba nuttalli TaxID=412467 RepID=A0ABQ0D7A6_9EUKA